MSSILANYYDILTEIIIANGTKVKINPDQPYTVLFYQDDRTIGQSTGIIRGVIGETHTIVMIPLNKENVNFATIIDTYKIDSVKTYTFNAHFTEFNNWVGVEVAENQSIDVRIKYATGESITRVEVNNTYDVSYVTSANGEKYLKTGTGKVIGIVRTATREYMPGNHAGHFSNKTNHIIQFDFGEANNSCIESVNVLDIRTIRTYIPAPTPVDISELHTLLSIEEQMGRLDKPELYVHHTFDGYRQAMLKGYTVVHNPKATEDEVKMTLKNLREAILALRLVMYDKDLVEYDHINNILYCNESAMPVEIKGTEFDYQIVEYYTTFGAKKFLRVEKDLSLFFTYANVDFDNIKPVTEEEELPICEECQKIILKFRQKNGRYNIIATNASFGSVFLGKSFGYSGVQDPNVITTEPIRPDGTRFIFGENPINAKFDNCTINELYLGGSSVNTISDGNTADLNNCKVGAIYAGDYSEEGIMPLEETQDESETTELEVYETGTVTVKNSEVDQICCSGIYSCSKGVTITVTGNSKVKTIYGVAHGGTSETTYIGVSGTSEVDKLTLLNENSKLCEYINVYTTENGKINTLTVGAESPDLGEFITIDEPVEGDAEPTPKPVAYIILNANATIGNIVRGYNGSTYTEDDLVHIDIPLCTIGNNGFDTPIPTITVTPEEPEGPDQILPEEPVEGGTEGDDNNPPETSDGDQEEPGNSGENQEGDSTDSTTNTEPDNGDEGDDTPLETPDEGQDNKDGVNENQEDNTTDDNTNTEPDDGESTSGDDEQV